MKFIVALTPPPLKKEKEKKRGRHSTFGRSANVERIPCNIPADLPNSDWFVFPPEAGDQAAHAIRPDSSDEVFLASGLYILFVYFNIYIYIVMLDVFIF